MTAATPAIGNLRHRLALEAPVRTADGAGGAAIAWCLIAELWGAIHPLSGDERLDSDRLAARLTHDIGLRFRDDVAPDKRLRFGARVFQIRAVRDVDDRRRFIVCRCEEIVT